MIVCACGLSLCVACSLLFEEPVHRGPTIVIREYQEPKIISYPGMEEQTEAIVEHEITSPLEPEQAPGDKSPSVELVSASEDAASQNLRRQRIPLRRNRQMLLQQQNLSTNHLQN